MKTAVVQFEASTDKADNLDKITSLIYKAASNGAVLCAFPEFMMFYTDSTQTPKQLAQMSESIDGEFVSTLSNTARDNHIDVVGSFYEKSPKKNKVYDTSIIISKTGHVISAYRKIHLYDALGFKESKKFESGSVIAAPVKTSVGKTGMMICYDLRFPEMSRHLAVSGSEILVAPSAWVQGEMKEEHWIVINKTRAIENGCYVVAPGHVGNIYCGRSLVVDPFGRVLLDMKQRRGIGYVDIDVQNVQKIRRVLPLLKNRRVDVYRDNF